MTETIDRPTGSDTPQLKLAEGFTFSDLYDRDGLVRIDAAFVERLSCADAELAARLAAARAAGEEMDRKEQSDLMLDLVHHVDDFIAELFGIECQNQALHARLHGSDNVYACKRLFVQRKAAKAYKEADAVDFDGPALRARLEELIGEPFGQIPFSNAVMAWMEDDEANADALDLAARYAAWALHTDDGRRHHAADVVFRKPEKVDHTDLVPLETVEVHGVEMLRQPADKPLYDRDAFHLTDHGCDDIGALDQAHYCIICHEQGRDYCSRGNLDRKTKDFTKNPLGITLEGCPLEERISEMHKAFRTGHALAALSIIVVDNPMCAGTGHRICNDCMKACIYQKQEPVDIPQVETRVLKDVLDLPWGFEVYSVLTRWNPMNFARPLPKPASGYKVLVVGLGPAGYTLSHYLQNEGHDVFALEGLKIEPLATDISGVDAKGGRHDFRPIHDVSELRESLDARVLAGFGGVAEYGITVRWDKNYLKLLRLLLERRNSFSMFGGVRFGGAITAEQAFAMGFDHIALCMGAGRPTFLSIPNGLARGVRAASDFLMALQLTGAAKADSLANLQIRLPAVVIGGGLTAVDTATEALAYYVRQVEKFATRYATLADDIGADGIRETMNAEEREVADEFLAHGQAIIAEREAAKADGRSPKFLPLLESWGGVTLAYRRRLADAPSYQLNHEEVAKAFEQGIRVAELVSPSSIDVDDNGQAEAIHLERQKLGEDGRLEGTGEEVCLPARTILVAAGTQPNTVLAREQPGYASVSGKYFEALNDEGEAITLPASAKPQDVQVIAHREQDGRCISFFGDLHPSYAGNVVKAMASAKQGYPSVDTVLRTHAATQTSAKELAAYLNDGLRAVVHEVKRLTPGIVEVIIRAPMAVQAFEPGQFFRLQNYETGGPRIDDTTIAMEGLALTGAWVDTERDLISLIVLEMGGSSDFCQYLKPGEPVIMMGPTGMPTETPPGETVMLVGGGLGNAVLLSIGRAFRAAGSKVLYFAGYKKLQDRYHVDLIEAAADTIVWCCDEGPGFEPSRDTDMSFHGNIVQAMATYAKGELGATPVPMQDVDRIIAIGSDRMMDAVRQARHDVLEPYLKPEHQAIGSINSPMQCMMKEICAQCLQPHEDPRTGERSVVFSCFNQDQPLDHVVFPMLHQRLIQNSVQEKLSKQWIARMIRHAPPDCGTSSKTGAAEFTAQPIA